MSQSTIAGPTGSDELRTVSRADRDAALLVRALKIADEGVRGNAANVDFLGRFPRESFDAIREAGLLGAYVPVEFGGGGASVAGIVAIGHVLAQRCASTGMIYAMHQIQAGCLVHHGQHIPALRTLLGEVGAEKMLLASATTEAGIGGDLGSSTCHVQRLPDGRFRVQKDAPVISYADDANAVLVTAKRNADAPSSDQVIAIGNLGAGTLERTSTWDALGMRGTCSNGYKLDVTGPADHVMDTPYAEMSAVSMIPLAHLTWAGVWTGIAADALDTARRYLRAQARKSSGQLPAIAADVAQLFGRYEALKGTVDHAIATYQAMLDENADHESRLQTAGAPGFSLRMLTLKTIVSEEVLRIVQAALNICGLAGYLNTTPFSLGRHLRDANSAPLMVHNERIYANSGALLCIYKES